MLIMINTRTIWIINGHKYFWMEDISTFSPSPFYVYNGLLKSFKYKAKDLAESALMAEKHLQTWHHSTTFQTKNKKVSTNKFAASEAKHKNQSSEQSGSTNKLGRH